MSADFRGIFCEAACEFMKIHRKVIPAINERRVRKKGIGVRPDLNLEFENLGCFSGERWRIRIDKETIDGCRFLSQAHQNIVLGVVNIRKVRVDHKPASKRFSHIFLLHPKGEEIANL